LQFIFGNGNAGTFYLDDVSVEPAVASVPDGGTTASFARLRFARLACLAAQMGG